MISREFQKHIYHQAGPRVLQSLASYKPHKEVTRSCQANLITLSSTLVPARGQTKNRHLEFSTKAVKIPLQQY